MRDYTTLELLCDDIAHTAPILVPMRVKAGWQRPGLTPCIARSSSGATSSLRLANHQTQDAPPLFHRLVPASHLSTSLTSF